MLNKYHGLCPDVGGKAKKLNLLVLKEQVQSETAIDKTKLGEMMWTSGGAECPTPNVQRDLRLFDPARNSVIDIQDC
eukprot:4880554-Alexandrium_andersonii.AAC.1